MYIEPQSVPAKHYANGVSAVTDEIIAVTDQIAGSNLPFEALNEAIVKLEKLIFLLDDEDPAQLKIFTNNVLRHRQPTLIDAYCHWETVLENDFANAILTGSVRSIEAYPLYERFHHLVSKELALVGDFPFNSVLFIGSGPFPITAILLHLLSGRPVTCLEKNEEAARVSRIVLEKLGLTAGITVRVGDGATFDVAPYDLILNALLAKPKWLIMKNIRNNGGEHARVLCRTSYGLRQLLYESTSASALHGFETQAQQVAGDNDTISTLLVTNKKEKLRGIEVEWLQTVGDGEMQGIRNLMNRIILTDDNNGFLTPIAPDSNYLQSLNRDVEAGLKHVMVLREGGRCVGKLVLSRSFLHTYAHRAEVCGLMIDPDIRGKEVSLKVAEALINKCECLGLNFLTLDVRAGSKTELLWKHLGFVQYGKLPCYAKTSDDEYEGIFLYQQVSVLKTTLSRKFEALYR